MMTCLNARSLANESRVPGRIASWPTSKDGGGLSRWSVSRPFGQLRPRGFMLENIEGLRTQLLHRFRLIMGSLRTGGQYAVFVNLLDAKEHRLPQSRKRLFILGIETSHYTGTFEWPDSIGVNCDGKRVQSPCRPSHNSTSVICNVNCEHKDLSQPHEINCRFQRFGPSRRMPHLTWIAWWEDGSLRAHHV